MCQFLVIDNLTLGRKRVRHGDAAAFNQSDLGCFTHPLSPPLNSIAAVNPLALALRGTLPGAGTTAPAQTFSRTTHSQLMANIKPCL